MPATSQQAAVGAVLGAFVGDAAGVSLEFIDITSDEQVRRAMTMPGGGVFRVGPGQISDDSELALCMLRVSKTAVIECWFGTFCGLLVVESAWQRSLCATASARGGCTMCPVAHAPTKWHLCRA